MQATQDKQMLTRDQAADFLGVRAQTLAVWHSTGRYSLPCVKLGRCVRYRVSDLEAFIASRTCTHTGERAGI